MPATVQKRILLVDSDASFVQTASRALLPGVASFACANTGEQAFNLLDAQPTDALVTQLHAARIEGARLMAVARDRNPDVATILLVAEEETEEAIRLLGGGAHDFLVRPANLGHLEAVLRRALRVQDLLDDRVALRRRLDDRYGFGTLVGRSRQMTQVYNAVRQAARTQTPVLLAGETGTGKCLIAQTIHTNGPRRDEALVTLDASLLDEQQATLELFGSSRGEGAASGRIELADGGTLYIDEFHCLSGALQERLAQVLHQGYTQRQADARMIPASIRLVASTRTPLAQLLASGALHDSLYALFGTSVIESPPLREHPEDIPLLVEHFAQDGTGSSGKRMGGVANRAMDLLMRYSWPENVRELRNVVTGMVLGSKDGAVLDLESVPDHIRSRVAPTVEELRIPVGMPMADVERMMIEATLKRTGNDKEACAKALGIGLRTLYRKLKQYEGNA